MQAAALQSQIPTDALDVEAINKTTLQQLDDTNPTSAQQFENTATATISQLQSNDNNTQLNTIDEASLQESENQLQSSIDITNEQQIIEMVSDVAQKGETES